MYLQLEQARPWQPAPAQDVNCKADKLGYIDWWHVSLVQGQTFFVVVQQSSPAQLNMTEIMLLVHDA